MDPSHSFQQIQQIQQISFHSFVLAWVLTRRHGRGLRRSASITGGGKSEASRKPVATVGSLSQTPLRAFCSNFRNSCSFSTIFDSTHSPHARALHATPYEHWQKPLSV